MCFPKGNSIHRHSHCSDIFRIWWNSPFSSCNIPLYLLWYHYLDIYFVCAGSSPFLCLLFKKVYIFSHPLYYFQSAHVFIFKMHLLMTAYVCIFIFLIQFHHISLLIRVFSLLTNNIIIDKFRFKSTDFLFIFYLSFQFF